MQLPRQPRLRASVGVRHATSQRRGVVRCFCSADRPEVYGLRGSAAGPDHSSSGSSGSNGISDGSGGLHTQRHSSAPSLPRWLLSAGHCAAAAALAVGLAAGSPAPAHAAGAAAVATQPSSTLVVAAPALSHSQGSGQASSVLTGSAADEAGSLADGLSGAAGASAAAHGGSSLGWAAGRGYGSFGGSGQQWAAVGPAAAGMEPGRHHLTGSARVPSAWLPPDGQQQGRGLQQQEQGQGMDGLVRAQGVRGPAAPATLLQPQSHRHTSPTQPVSLRLDDPSLPSASLPLNSSSLTWGMEQQQQQRSLDSGDVSDTQSFMHYYRNVTSSGKMSSNAGGSSGGGSDLGYEVASDTEDRLLEAARQVEARLEGVLGALAGGVPQLLPPSASTVEAANEVAHSLIREVWEVVDANYLDARSTGFDRDRWAGLRDAALGQSYRDTGGAHRAIRDMLARGLSDPYCRFVPASELAAMKKYDVSGVGLNLGTAREFEVKTGNPLPPRDPSAGEGVFVVGVSKGSPADNAGIRQGDELLAVGGVDLGAEEASPFYASSLISGAQQPEGQAQGRGQQADSDLVRIKVRRPTGDESELSVSRPRRVVPSAVSTSLVRSPVTLPGGGRAEEVVGTVRLSAFNARAQSDVSAAIRQLEAAGASRLVLDLRDNRGGLVTEGLEVARLFLEGDAPIVITERRDGPPDTPRAPGPALTDAPLLVLVNSHTASASEIVAGALHDNCRAVLAGGRTYGKGLIQSVYELSDGSGLVITVGKYLTPSGTDIDRYGIKPDFSSVPSPAQATQTLSACRLQQQQLPAPPVVAEAGLGAGFWGSGGGGTSVAAVGR